MCREQGIRHNCNNWLANKYHFKTNKYNDEEALLADYYFSYL